VVAFAVSRSSGPSNTGGVALKCHARLRAGLIGGLAIGNDPTAPCDGQALHLLHRIQREGGNSLLSGQQPHRCSVAPQKCGRSCHASVSR